MTYTWNKTELIEIRQNLLARKTQSIEEKKLKTNDLFTLEEMLNIINHTTNEIEEGKIKDTIRENIKEFQELPNFIKNWIFKSKSLLKTYNIDLSIPKLTKISLSNEDLVALSHDFYKWIPNKNYMQLVREYTNPKNHQLYFTEENNDFNGLTYSTYYPMYKPFLAIFRENTIEDVITLNHELAHSIYNAFEPRKISHYYLKELEGFTFDFLSTIFLLEKKMITTEMANTITINTIDNIICSLYQFFLAHIMRNLKRDKKLNLKNIKKEINKEFPQTDFLKENIVNLKNEVSNIISFLISLDLAFEKDFEKSFYKFEKIKTNPSNNIQKVLEQNGITFMHDNCKNLKDCIQKLNLKI